MADDNIVKFPPRDAPEFLVGPFREWRVVVDGRMIPGLTGCRDGDDRTCLVLDHRFGLTVPNEYAYGVASFVANALAIGAGYPWYGAETKDRPFAARSMQFGPDAPEGGDQS